MAKRQKIITAGRLVITSTYSVPHRSEPDVVRAAKTKCSTAAQHRMNLKYAWQKLELELAANFGAGDIVVTLTYDDAYLPPDRAAAIKLIKKYWVQLRRARRLQGQSLKYIYVTEGLHDDKRLHHHAVINGTGDDFELLQSLWKYGAVHIVPLDISAGGYEPLARYLTKEPRETGTANGKRCWIPSRGLIKPKTESTFVRDDLSASVPPGAVILDTDRKVTQFGTFDYIKYLLPDKPKIRHAHKNKKSISNFLGL